MQDVGQQAFTGLTPPQAGEALIREAWPSVAARPGVASVGRVLTRSIIGAPLAWLLMGLFYFLKVFPFLATRYTLTNRRLMIRRGLRPEPAREIALAEIDDVRLLTDANSEFFRAGTLEILSHGKPVLTLPGVPEPESFRRSILDACAAWVPGRTRGVFVPAKAAAAG